MYAGTSFKILLFVMSRANLFSSEHKSCRTFFSQQPPSTLPCNPYSINTTVNLQCQVSAPIHEINPQELNFTIIWVKKLGYENAKEEIIYPSELASTGLEVYIRESRFVRDKEVVLMLSSSLTIHFDQERELGANYWCRVLVKDLENYFYEHEGDSISTKVEKQDFYSNTVIFYPPCERGSSLHQSGLTCVNNEKSGHLVTSSTSELPIGLKDIFWSDVVIVVIFLGLLIGSLAIVLILGTYSCAIHMPEERPRLN